jgi:hypothetical protein
MRARRDVTFPWCKMLIIGIVVLVFALVGRPAPVEPSHHRPQHNVPATEQERLEHDVKQAWEIEQATKR